MANENDARPISGKVPSSEADRGEIHAIDGRAPDRSNGYEQTAQVFMANRHRHRIGAATVRFWAAALPDGAAVLELGCGDGVPISEVLMEAGVRLHAVDASPTLLRVFQERYPSVPTRCESVEDSDFFGRSFDAVVAWGLMFLLPATTQRELIPKVADHLVRDGQFLFTAPPMATEWKDVVTGKTSVSLGRDEYAALLRAAGLTLVQELEDEGENHYFISAKR